MPKWWKDRASHIREKNPDMPEGMEWALATEQYKEEFGRPPRRHKKKKSELVTKLVQLADQLDEKGFLVEANAIDALIKTAFVGVKTGEPPIVIDGEYLTLTLYPARDDVGDYFEFEMKSGVGLFLSGQTLDKNDSLIKEQFLAIDRAVQNFQNAESRDVIHIT